MNPSGLQRDEKEEEAGHERWLVSYADFITLMFAFFVILYATSQKDVEKSKQFQESLKRFLIKAGPVGQGAAQVDQGDKHNSLLESPIQTFRPTKNEAATTVDEAEAYLEAKFTPEERKRFLTDILSDEWGVRLILPSQALFSDGSEKFRPEALAFISKLGALLAQSKRKILIEGHVNSDEVGGFRSTWDFASARAVNMLRLIQRKENLASEQLAAASLGDSRPLPASAHGKSSNSRLEVVLLNHEMEL